MGNIRWDTECSRIKGCKFRLGRFVRDYKAYEDRFQANNLSHPRELDQLELLGREPTGLSRLYY